MIDDRDAKIDVLDHGFVRRVNHMGGDLDIVRAARVSYDADWRAGEDTGSDARLIKYLWAHRHYSPFEAVEFQFEVYAPIFVFRQWHRHRTWSFNELSLRYKEHPTEEYYVPSPDKVGRPSAVSKQGRDFVSLGEPDAVALDICNKLFEASDAAFDRYRELLDLGCPRELARVVLPLNTYSHMFAKVDLRNLFHFILLRSDAHAQYEIRVYSDAMLKLIRPIVPVAVEAWEADKG